MSNDDTKKAATKFYSAINAGTALAELDKHIAPDFIDHNTPPGLSGGRDGVRAVLEAYRSDVTDLALTPLDMIAEGDKIAVRLELACVHSGTFFGMPPTGKRIVGSMIEILRVRDGLIVERWGIWDALSILGQLK